MVRWQSAGVEAAVNVGAENFGLAEFATGRATGDDI